MGEQLGRAVERNLGTVPDDIAKFYLWFRRLAKLPA